MSLNLYRFHYYRYFRNEIFRGYRKPILLTKRQAEEKSSASIILLLSRRMREGFTVDVSLYDYSFCDVKNLNF